MAASYTLSGHCSSAGLAEAHNGTVAPRFEMPMFAAVTADAPRPHPGDRDLAAAGIGLLASPTEAAQAAETMLRRRYRWAEAEGAQSLVALGGDGFMLQTLHRMLEGGVPRPV